MRKIKHKINNNGFTLVEMLVVILIIGVLMTVSANAFINIRENARKTRASMMAKQLAEAWNLYALQNGFFPLDKMDSFPFKHTPKI